MGDMATGSSPPQKRRRWGRVVGFILGGLLLLLVIFYFVASSDFFVQKVVLPRVSKALNARVTVSDSSVSPFSHVVLRGLKVQTTGNEPLATVQEARVHYSLGAILYELLAGQPPFKANSFSALLKSIAEDEPLPLAAVKSKIMINYRS